MITLQEQFEKDFPDKSVRKINAQTKYFNISFTNYDLDLSEYVNLEILDLRVNNLISLNLKKNQLTELLCENNKITSINLSECKKLTYLNLPNNNLTSVDFLNALPNPEKLEKLVIYSNNIQPTDIEYFSKFVNLISLLIGTMKDSQKFGNRFYGSFKSYQNLTKLENICIEVTDVNEGLEYLPFSLAQSVARMAKENKVQGGYSRIECSPHDTNAKCKAIQDLSTMT